MRNVGIILFVCVLVACSNTATPAAITFPAATGPAPLAAAPVSNLQVDPITAAEYLAEFLPKCEGLQILDDPITFDWPNIKKRSQDLAEGNWGYFTCKQPPAVVTDFYKTEFVKPPHNLVEINWVERRQGFLGLYYFSPNQSWFYVWVIPQTKEKLNSYVVVVQSDASIFTPGECRIDERSASSAAASLFARMGTEIFVAPRSLR